MADSLEELRAELEQREANNRARANGMQIAPGNERPTAPPEPEGFDAGTVWNFPYNLNPYVDATGYIPPPPQELLDSFTRDMGRLMAEYEKAARDAEDAQRKADEARQDQEEDSEEILTRQLAELDQYLEEKRTAMGRMKNITAKLCQGSPSREELDGLPEYVFQRFADTIGRKINPEV